jgi:hypothetical protein
MLRSDFALLSGSSSFQHDHRPQRPAVALTLRSFLESLDRFRTRHRRRLTFLTPAVERRGPRIAAEDYAARHSIEHTLDRKAELRRLAPTLPSAARRYRQLLTLELEGLRELVSALHSVAGDRELEECLAEAALQMERLEIEIAWCSHLPGNAAESVAAPG